MNSASPKTGHATVDSLGTPSSQENEHEIVAPEQVPHGTSTRIWLALAAIVFQYTCALGSALPLLSIIDVINADLGPDPIYTWIASAWLVVAAVGMLLAGALSDLLGRRWFMIVTTIAPIITGILGATAHSLGQVIAASVFLGISTAGNAVAFSAAAELVPTKWRGIIIGIMNLAATAFVTCGSLIAHEMVDNTAPGWRTLYWFMIAINTVATVFIALTYFPAKPLASSGVSHRAELVDDYIGLVGICTGPTLFLLGIIWIPQYGARSARFVGPFVSGCLVTVATGIYEAHWAKNPLLHPVLFRRIRTFTLMLVVSAVGGMLFYALSSFFPTFLALVFDGPNGRQIGIDGMPFGAGTQVGGVGSAILLPFLGSRIGTQWMLAGGVLLQSLFIPLMHLVPVDNKAMALGFSFVGGLGIGVAELLTILLVQLSTPDEWLGFATGSVGLCRTMGGSVGTAIYSTIFQSKAATLLPARVAAVALAGGMPASSLPAFIGVLTGAVSGTPITDVPGATPEIIQASTVAVKEAYLQAFRWVWITSIAFGIVAFLCAAATKDLSPNLTMKVAQHLAHEPIATSDFEVEKTAGIELREKVPDGGDDRPLHLPVPV